MQVAGQVAASTAAAVLGLAVPGPGGVLISAATAPILTLIAARDARGVENIELLFDEAATALGLSLDELVTRAKATEGRLLLATDAARAALNTLNSAKVHAIARILAEGLADDARLDLSWLMTAAVQDLEAPQVRVLGALVAHPERASQPNEIWDIHSIRRELPNLASGTEPIMATLTRHGLTYSPGAIGHGIGPWRVSEFGEQVLSYLREMGEESRGPV